MGKKYNVIAEEFESIDRFLQVINSRRTNKVFNGQCSSARRGDTDFYGCETIEEAEKLIKEGYERPLREIKKAMRKHAFNPNAVVARQRPQSNIMGYAPLVPNAILGLPNSMIHTEKQPMKMKAVTIRYSIGVVASVRTETIIKAGIATLNIVNLLELSGYRVKLIVEPKTSTCRGTDDLTCVSINVKDFREQLDLKKLSFPLVHPAMQRRFGFKWLETCERITKNDWNWGYGQSVSNEKYEDAKRIYEDNGLIDQNTYLLNVTLCQEEDFNIDNIMERSGIAKVINQAKKGA